MYLYFFLSLKILHTYYSRFIPVGIASAACIQYRQLSSAYLLLITKPKFSAQQKLV
jgi:hypothetical protein